jgi:uncharacterized protein (DUF2236 family)
MPPLTPDELAAYFAESQTLAALFGLPPTALPHDWSAFLAYCRTMEESDQLGVSRSARTMAHDLLLGAGSWIKPPHWYRSLTTAWLPERFRSEFGVDFGDAERQAAENATRWLPRVYRKFPGFVRFVGPWHEAQARLKGKGASLMHGRLRTTTMAE